MEVNMQPVEELSQPVSVKGAQGQNVRAMRTIVDAAANKLRRRVVLEIVE
jgi:hypothetical protein